MAHTLLWTNVIHPIYKMISDMPVSLSMAQRCYKPEHILIARSPGCILMPGEAKDLMFKLSRHGKFDASFAVEMSHGTVGIINAMKPQSVDVLEILRQQRAELFFPLTDIQLETLLLSVFDRAEFERFESVGPSSRTILLREKLRFLNGLSVEQYLEIESRSVARRLLALEKDMEGAARYAGLGMDIADTHLR
jgi:hypothetical protein